LEVISVKLIIYNKIAEDLNFVEAATGKNMTDIAYLKLAK
jgi:hypothetical protein